MKIVQCTSCFPPSEGGVERAVFRLSQHLVKLGHNVTVFTFNYLPTSKEKIGPICDYGLKAHEVMEDIGVRRFSYSGFLPTGSKFSLALIYNLLKAKPDIIHIHGINSLPNILLVGVCGKIIGRPVILTAHGMHEAWSWLLNGKSSSIGLSILKLVLRSVRKVIALTDFSRLALRKLGVDPATIFKIPNGVELSRFESRKVNKQILDRYRYGINGSQVVLCVSRIAEHKGLHNLVIAASEVCREIDDVVFLIVGRIWSKHYRHILDFLVNKYNLSGNVIFANGVSDDDLTELYKLSTIFAFPSESETGPLVLLEAMAAGCPVVTTRVGMVPEVIENQKNGIIVNYNDPKELAERIITLLKDGKLRHEIGTNGKETVKRYSWKEIARKTLDVYLSV